MGVNEYASTFPLASCNKERCNHRKKTWHEKKRKYAIVFASTQLRITRLRKYPIDPKAYLGRCIFMPNGISHCYQLDQSISALRAVGWYFFYFYPNFKRNFCRQTVENLIRHCILRRLIWFCNVCRCPTKRVLGLYGLMKISRRRMTVEIIS